jgi:hypothetical protein
VFIVRGKSRQFDSIAADRTACDIPLARTLLMEANFAEGALENLLPGSDGIIVDAAPESS